MNVFVCEIYANYKLRPYKLYRQTIGIPIGTNCAPLVVDVFHFGMKEIS